MAEQGKCPVCDGTKTNNCNNCGGQKMWGKPTGLVFLRKDGTPCEHEYTSTKLGNCYYGYSCKHCPESFAIDSGD